MIYVVHERREVRAVRNGARKLPSQNALQPGRFAFAGSFGRFVADQALQTQLCVAERIKKIVR